MSKKHQQGRKTLYSEELEEKARWYIDNFKELEQVIPSIAGLAVYLGLNRETLRLWSKDQDHPFFGIICDLMAKQEVTLANNGLSGGFNSTITKLMLTKHDYSDKVDNTLAAPDGGPVAWSLQPVKPSGKTDND